MKLSTSSKATAEGISYIDRKAVLTDKRVIPPLSRPRTRISGTLHLPSLPRQADGRRDAVAI